MRELINWRQRAFPSPLDHPELARVTDVRREWEASVAAHNRALEQRVTAIEVGGIPAELVVACDAARDRLIIHFHGGGYNAGSPRTHRGLAARLSAAAASGVLVVDYRLAPEYPCPSAVEDALAAYEHVLELGWTPRQLVISGDSSGGGLAVAALAQMAQQGIAAPAAAVLMSPWVDMTLSGATIDTLAELDALVSRAGLTAAAGLYLGSRDASDSLASPLFGDLSGLPPVLVQAGDAEILLDDARRLATGINEAGGRATLDVYPGMGHIFQADSTSPGSEPALDRAGRFIRSQTSTPKETGTR